MNSNWRNDGSTRRDLRPINDPATAAGIRNVHRDLRGNVIGGYTAEGQPLGTKRRSNAFVSPAASTTTPAAPVWRQPPTSVPGPASNTQTTPANPSWTPAFVGPPDPKQQAEMIAGRDAEAKRAQQRTEARQAAGRPSEQAITAARKKGINPLTGMRFGVGPGDDGYDVAWYDRYKKTGYGLDEPTSKERFDKFRHAAGELASKAMQTVGNAAGTVARGALRGFGAFAPALSAVVKNIQANPPVDPKKAKTPRS